MESITVAAGESAVRFHAPTPPYVPGSGGSSRLTPQFGARADYCRTASGDQLPITVINAPDERSPIPLSTYPS